MTACWAAAGDARTGPRSRGRRRTAAGRARMHQWTPARRKPATRRPRRGGRHERAAQCRLDVEESSTRHWRAAPSWPQVEDLAQLVERAPAARAGPTKRVGRGSAMSALRSCIEPATRELGEAEVSDLRCATSARGDHADDRRPPAAEHGVGHDADRGPTAAAAVRRASMPWRGQRRARARSRPPRRRPASSPGLEPQDTQTRSRPSSGRVAQPDRAGAHGIPGRP